MTLHEFRALPHRFRWGGMGGDDCTTFCATWVREQTGIDPAEDLRGSYRDGEGATRILTRAGGIIRFMGGRLQPLGYKRVQQPQSGDIGVVRAPVGIDEIKEIGAICFGPLWLILGPGGVVGKKVDFVAAWRLTA